MTHADRPRVPDWTRSSFSQSNGGECIEWAPEYARTTGTVLVRDSKNPTGPHLTLTPNQWTVLVTYAQNHD